MEQFIGCDAHKRYSLFVAVGEDGGCSPAWKASHTDGAFEAFLEDLPKGSEIALEACSSYYWMVTAMERTGHHPHLAHPEASDAFGVRGREQMTQPLGALPPHTRQSVEQQLAVLWLESGAVERFPDAPNLASYAGLVPRVRASGGHTRLGPVCRDVNHHLKWAFVEAANLVAVARHRAEAAYWILKKREAYREPKTPRLALSSTHG